MSEDQATKNTDTVLHEDVDCRIILTAQHALGIDVGGTVIVRSPLEWHRMAMIKEAPLPNTHTQHFVLETECARNAGASGRVALLDGMRQN